MFDSFGLGFIVLGRGCLLGYCSLVVLGVIGVFLFASIGVVGCIWVFILLISGLFTQVGVRDCI